MPTTAVLLFALPDIIESGRKTVARHSSLVWRAMRLLTQAKVHASGLPLLQSHQLITHQGTFGEQISAALSVAFERGYEQVICIGNDCPDLSVSDIRRAATSLSANQFPVGADRRGGVYLFGLNRKQFDARAITELPWQTNRVADALHSWLTAYPNPIDQLPVRADINHRIDHRIDAMAVRWSGRVASRLAMMVRQALLSCGKVSISFLFIESGSSVPRRVSSRAPPFV